MNRIIIIGRLTRDPEIKYTQGGKAIANITVAVDRRFKGPDGKHETDFFDCVVWNKLAESVGNYMTKGKQVAVEGEMRCEKWQDKEGNNRYTWKLNAGNVQFLGSKSDGGSKSAPASDDTIFEEPSDRTIDEELERNQPYGF